MSKSSNRPKNREILPCDRCVQEGRAPAPTLRESVALLLKKVKVCAGEPQITTKEAISREDMFDASDNWVGNGLKKVTTVTVACPNDLVIPTVEVSTTWASAERHFTAGNMVD